MYLSDEGYKKGLHDGRYSFRCDEKETVDEVKPAAVKALAAAWYFFIDTWSSSSSSFSEVPMVAFSLRSTIFLGLKTLLFCTTLTLASFDRFKSFNVCPW